MKTLRNPLLWAATAAILLLGLCAHAQDTNNPASPTKTATSFFSDWFKDNTNFWSQHTARLSVVPLYSKGHATADADAPDKDTFGGAVSLSFPVDENGQVSAGIFGAYFDQHFFVGSVNLTLGKTVNVPLINRPLFLWAEGGPALNLNHPDELLAQAFAGGTFKIDIIDEKLNEDGSVKTHPWTLLIGAGYGKVTGWQGNIIMGTLGLNHTF